MDLWLPGAETVTAEGAMFDCCVLVANEMNGAYGVMSTSHPQHAYVLPLRLDEQV